MGPANRIDLLVKAPAGTGTFPFNITANTSVSGAQNGQAPQVLFNINVTGSGNRDEPRRGDAGAARRS